MGLIQSLTDKLGSDSDTAVRTYVCESCGEKHESAKSLDRATCPECLSTDVTPAETA